MSRAFAMALVGHAGAIATFGAEFDYGVDCDVEDAVLIRGRPRRTGFPISLQLKATTRWKIRENHIVYALEAKAWDDMVSRVPAAVPLYLALLCLPPSEEDWFDCTEERMVFQRCCYYFRATGDFTTNTNSVTVHIPVYQRLTPESLRLLLDEAQLRFGET